MTELEKIADKLGQCVFAIETNLSVVEKRCLDANSKGAVEGITQSLETLKELKTKINSL